jgi:hypothetical protein
MSANTQNSSTEVGSEPPAVAVNAAKNNANNAPKNNTNTPKNNANANNAPKNNANANKNNANTPKNNANTNAGKNPVLEKISQSVTTLQNSIQGANCSDIHAKTKQVIENAEPVLTAIEKQEIRENNSELANVKGKLKATANSIRKACPSGSTQQGGKRKQKTRKHKQKQKQKQKRKSKSRRHKLVRM